MSDIQIQSVDKTTNEEQTTNIDLNKNIAPEDIRIYHEERAKRKKPISEKKNAQLQLARAKKADMVRARKVENFLEEIEKTPLKKLKEPKTEPKESNTTVYIGIAAAAVIGYFIYNGTKNTSQQAPTQHVQVDEPYRDPTRDLTNRFEGPPSKSAFDMYFNTQ